MYMMLFYNNILSPSIFEAMLGDLAFVVLTFGQSGKNIYLLEHDTIFLQVHVITMPFSRSQLFLFLESAGNDGLYQHLYFRNRSLTSTWSGT